VKGSRSRPRILTHIGTKKEPPLPAALR